MCVTCSEKYPVFQVHNRGTQEPSKRDRAVLHRRASETQQTDTHPRALSPGSSLRPGGRKTRRSGAVGWGAIESRAGPGSATSWDKLLNDS